MDKHIQEIKDKLKIAQKQVRKYTSALETLQDVCDHEWRYEGHGHNDSLYICDKCGAEEWK